LVRVRRRRLLHHSPRALGLGAPPPKAVPEWSLISLIDASPFDAGTAYVAVDAHKLDNFKPYIFTTTDFGKTWATINTGIPDGAYVHAVREVPARKGLLFAGTETGIYFSFDDGAHWQSLQLNLPNSPVHDMAIHGNDLAVATHGRAFWILDDISPLRQADSSIVTADAHLFAPSNALRSRIARVRRRRNAIGENPPNGAILYYYLKEEPKEPIKMEILDGSGKTIRTLTSEEKKEESHEGESDKDDNEDHIPPKRASTSSPGICATPSRSKFPRPFTTKANPLARSRCPAPIRCA
jgi:hypothetical protein